MHIVQTNPFKAVIYGPLPESIVYPCEVYGWVDANRCAHGYTLDEGTATIAGWDRIGTLIDKDTLQYVKGGFPSRARSVDIIDLPTLLTSRTKQLTAGALKGKHVGFVGTGASINLIVSCARTGVDSFSFWDLDIVEVPNIGRTAYDLADVGQPKTRAAHRHVLTVNPHATVHEYHGDFMAISDADLRNQMKDCDVIVMGTDAQQVQLRGNRIGHELGKEMVFPGFYSQGAGGEIVVVTNDGPCYRCQVRTRFEEEGLPAGSGDLKAESGLIFDCDHIDTVVGKIILALLLKDAVPSFKKLYDHVALNSLIFCKNDPDMKIAGVDLFGEYFGNTVLAFAYETLWLNPHESRDPECEVCGKGVKSYENTKKEEMVCQSATA